MGQLRPEAPELEPEVDSQYGSDAEPKELEPEDAEPKDKSKGKRTLAEEEPAASSKGSKKKKSKEKAPVVEEEVSHMYHRCSHTYIMRIT